MRKNLQLFFTSKHGVVRSSNSTTLDIQSHTYFLVKSLYSNKNSPVCISASIPTRRTIQVQRTGALQGKNPLMQNRMATFHPIVSPPGLGSGIAKPKSSILYSTGKITIKFSFNRKRRKEC